jgi:hypothetical protein
MKKWNPVFSIVAVLLAVDVALRIAGGIPGGHAFAQAGPPRQPTDIAIARSESGNSFVLYRMWSDGSIDVRLVNPFQTVAEDWVGSDKSGISYQEGWKKFQVGP